MGKKELGANSELNIVEITGMSSDFMYSLSYIK
jgi:hypothetical protein